MDTNISIRTFICYNNNIHAYAGGAIVQDSQCESEYEETFIKIQKMTNALEEYRVQTRRKTLCPK